VLIANEVVEDLVDWIFWILFQRKGGLGLFGGSGFEGA
jgi:hypothetical protein